MIDLNRSVDDDRLGDVRRHSCRCRLYTPGAARWRAGLIHAPPAGAGRMWNRRHDRTELAQRIAGIHEPIMPALPGALDGLRARWGAALLLDLHSMPPLPPAGGRAGAQFVIGDRFGAACHGALRWQPVCLSGPRRAPAPHNRPYAGAMCSTATRATYGWHAIPDRGGPVGLSRWPADRAGGRIARRWLNCWSSGAPAGAGGFGAGRRLGDRGPNRWPSP